MSFVIISRPQAAMLIIEQCLRFLQLFIFIQNATVSLQQISGNYSQ